MTMAFEKLKQANKLMKQLAWCPKHLFTKLRFCVAYDF